MNIDWRLVPKGYDWVAKDSDGCVTAYEEEPTLADTAWYAWPYKLLNLVLDRPWQDSILQRPECFDAVLELAQAAPTWAVYIAVDRNGNIYYYTTQPKPGAGVWLNARFTCCGDVGYSPDWKRIAGGSKT